MAIYTVLAPPARSGPVGGDPDRFLFIKDGFSWPALLVAPIWFLWHRMWLVFLLYLAASIGLGLLLERLPLPVAWVIGLLFAFLVALEANNMRRWTLERAGHRIIAVARGDNRSDAELRFFSNWAAPVSSKEDTSRKTPPGAPGPSDATERSEGNEVIGLFPKPRDAS